MRRTALALAATVAGLVLLLGFKTHPVRSHLTTVIAADPPSLPTVEPAPSAEPSPSLSPSPRRKASPKASPTPSPSVVATTEAVPSPSPLPLPSPKPSPKPSPTVTKKPTPKPSPSPVPPAAGPHQVAGSVVPTTYGNVQVAITVDGGRITAATVLQIPDQDDMDRDINDRAVPILEQQTVDRQSAQLDTVSGATCTSDGYRRSLQAAIDAAHL